jgi:hypothetical protein
MTVSNVAGSLFGTYLTSAVNGDIVTVTVLVQITLVVVIALLVSYYCDNLIPVTPDPKTRTDNIYAGVFGLVNSYLIVGSILGYLKAIPSQDPKVVTNIFSNSFNEWLFHLLPWVILAAFFCVIGWASVRKINEAINMLKASMQKPPAPSTSSTTGSLSTSSIYSAPAAPSWQQPSSSYSSGYQSSSVTAPVATPAVAAVPAEPKPSIFGRLFGGFGRKEEAPVPPPTNPAPTGFGSYGLGNTSGYQAPSSGYGSPSSATPPYGINTGAITGANPSYGTPAPTPYQAPVTTNYGTTSGFTSSYTPATPPPSYTASGGFGQPSVPSSGYQPPFGTPTPASGFTSPNAYGTNTNYGHQDEEPDYAEQSSFDEDNDQDDDNEGYGGYNGANQPPPYRG